MVSIKKYLLAFRILRPTSKSVLLPGDRVPLPREQDLPALDHAAVAWARRAPGRRGPPAPLAVGQAGPARPAPAHAPAPAPRPPRAAAHRHAGHVLHAGLQRQPELAPHPVGVGPAGKWTGTLH